MNIAQKIKTIEARVVILERTVRKQPKRNDPNIHEALKLLYGIWKKKKRTSSDLMRVRKHLWR